MEKWLLFAIFAGIFSTSFNYINRNFLKDNQDTTSYAWLFELTRTLLFVPIIILEIPFKVVSFSAIYLLLLGVVEFFSVYVFMKMHAHTHLSISTIVTRLRLVWVPILAYIFLREQLSEKDYLGIVIIFLGQSVIVSPRKFMIDKGIRLAFYSSFATAALALVMKKASELFPTAVITASMGIPTLLGYPFFMKDWRCRISSLWKKNRIPIIIATIFNALAMYFLIWALKLGGVSKVTAIYQSSLLFGVIVGIISLKEKDNIGKKIVGGVITVLGILLLI